MADGDTVITIKLKLDEGDAESSAATAGKDAGEAFRKAFEEATKGLDVSKGLKSDDLKKTFSQIGDEGKKTAKDLQDAFAKVQMPAAAAAGAPAGVPGTALAVPRMRYRPPEEDRRQEEQIHRHVENVSKGMEAFSSLLRGASLVEVARTAGPVFSALLAGRGGIAAGGRAAARAVSAEEVAGGGRAEEVLAGGIGAAVGGGVRGATGGGIAARFAGGAVGELMGGPVGAAIGTLAAGFIGSKIIDTITETGEAIKEMGIKGAVTDVQMVRMAQTMGLSTKGLLDLRDRFSKSGVDIEDFSRAIYRLSTSAQREMPVIQRQIKDANNVIVESNIKVNSSTREVAKAQDDRLATTERVTTAEGELAKFEATGAETRREQARAAELGVSGAAIRLRGAQMQERQAQIGLQFAPAQEALQAAQGPLTIKGAEVGLGGAKIQQWRAAIALRQAEGETVDPEEIKRLQLASARHQYAAASQTRKEAEQRVKQAETEAGEREAERGAGLGPTGQARQRMLQAAQAEQQAELAQQQAKTAKINLEFDQAYTPLLAQRNQRQRQLNEARRQEEAAPEAEELAKINKERATIARDHLKYEQIPSVQRAVQAAARGEEQPGFEFKEVPADVFRNAIIAQGGGQVGPILDVLSQFLRSPAMRGAGRAQQLQRVTDVLGSVRGIGGAEGPQGLLDTLLAAPEKRTPEQEKYFTQMAGLLERRLPESRKLIGRAGEVAEDKALEDLRTGLSAKSFADSILKLDKTVDSFSQGMKRFLLGTVGETDLEGAPQRGPTLRRTGGRPLTLPETPAQKAAAEERARRRKEEEDTEPVPEEDTTPGVHPAGKPLKIRTEKGRPRRKKEVSAEDEGEAKPPEEPPKPPFTVPGTTAVTVANPVELKAPKDQPPPPPPPPTTVSTGVGPAAVPPGGTAVTVAGGHLEVTGSVEVHGTVTVANCPCPQEQTGGGGGITATEQARGGLIRGPGSGTSDSIPILASNGEYIIRQSRVAQLGVPFLDALNNRRVRFNLGGLVSLQHGGRVDSPSSLQSYDEASVQRALYKAWTDAHGTTPDPDSWAQVMRAKLNPETALDRYGNITEEGKKQAEQKRQGLAASLPPELTDQSFWERLARTGRTKIDPGDPKSALAVASPGYMNELRRQMGLPPLLLPGMTADPQAQNAAADAQRAQLMKVEQSIADQLRTDVWSRLAMTGSTMISPGDPHSAGIVASPKFMQQLRDSLGIKVPVDQDMSVDAQLARTGVAWGGTTHSIKIVATRLYQNILRERFGLPKIPGVGPPQAAPGAPPGAAVPLTPRVPLGTPLTHRPPSGAPSTPGAPSGAPSTPGAPSGTPPTMQGKPGVPVISDDYLDHLQKNPGHIPQGPWQLYDSTAQTYVDMQPGKLLPVEPPAQTMWTIPTGPNGMFLTHDGVPAYRPPNNGMSLDYLETDKGKVFIPQGPWKIWDATRNTFIDMKPGLLQPVDPRAVMTPAPTPVPAVPVPGVTKPVAPPPRPDPNQPVLPTIKPSTAPEPPPPEPSQPAQPPTVTTPLPRPRPAEAPPPVPAISKPAEAPPPILPETVLPPRPAEPTRSTEDILKDLRENVIPSMIPTPKPAPGRLGRPEEQEVPKDLPPSDLIEGPSRHGEAERKVREASINGGEDEGAWRGGLIRLSGGGLVPAMVSNGEYRMSPEAVSHYGVSLFDRLNGGGFAGGGSITMGRAQPPRPAGFPSGFSPIPEPGLIGEIANAMRNIGGVDPGVIRTITGVASGAGEVASTHRLDLVTSAGTFTVQAGAETLAAIQSSAIGGKLTSTGARPSWY